MCYGSEPVRSSSSVATIPQAPKPVNVVTPSFRPASGVAKYSHNTGANLVYLVAATGPILFRGVSVTDADADESSDYRNDDARFQKDIDLGILKLIPAEPVVASPVDTRTDRLQAAEQDTGFKLGQKVQTNYSDDIVNGTVVGFARVDENGESGVRKVVIRHDNPTTELFDPSDLFAL